MLKLRRGGGNFSSHVKHNHTDLSLFISPQVYQYMHETITVNGCPEYQARATAKVRTALKLFHLVVGFRKVFIGELTIQQ